MYIMTNGTSSRRDSQNLQTFANNLLTGVVGNFRKDHDKATIACEQTKSTLGFERNFKKLTPLLLIVGLNCTHLGD